MTRFWNVAITGMNARPENPGPGYAVARCLYQAPDFFGRIIGLGYDVLDAGLYHDHCAAGYLLPYPSEGEATLLERILEVHAVHQLDAIIPCLDAELPSFIRLADRLKQHGIHTCLPRAEQLRARNKDRLPTLCKELGIAHPRTQAIPDAGFFRRCHNEGWSFPLVVKGPFYDATVAHTLAEAESAYFKLSAQWGFPVLVQEFLEGQEINLTGLGDGRGLLGTVMMRKRAVTDKGKAWAGVTVVDEQLERLAANLVAGLKWRGPLEVEVLRSHDGQLHLIEMNPRFPAWIYLSLGAERNLPRALLQLMAEEAIPPFPALKPGLMFLRYAEEMIVDLKDFESLMMLGTVVA